MKLLFLTIAIVLNCSMQTNIKKSDHFDGKKFNNPEPGHTFKDQVKWMLNMKTLKWPKWVEDSLQPPPPSFVGNNSVRITYINHATVLIQANGLNILTDPVWSERVGPYSWLGVKRVRRPGVDLADLPRIDYILISHNHYDHLDIPSLRLLKKKHDPVILTGIGVKEAICNVGFKNIVELDWWEEHEENNPDIQFTFVPARHSSGRGLFDKNKTLWGGFVIATNKTRIYFAGDTGYGLFVDSIKQHFDGFDIGILPIGSYEARWFMQDQHMNPDDAVKMQQHLNIHTCIGIHTATFAEHPEQSIDAHVFDLKKALKKYRVSEERFILLSFGEGRNFICN